MRRRTFVQTGAAAIAATTLSRLSRASSSGDIAAVTNAGSPITLSAGEVGALRKQLRGELLLRGDPAYDQARQVWNASIDRKPALIVRCVAADDVAAAVSFARKHQLLVAVRGGGHSSSGKGVCNDGLMIDLATFRGVTVNVASRTATVAGGSLLGELDAATLPHKLATTVGTVSHTGVGGLTLGGGLGHLGRSFGMTIDNLLSVQVVTADGEIRAASARENPDLFWGLRGGGGNFGVATSFEFRLHPFSGELATAELVYPLPLARQALKFLANYGPALPDATTITPVFIATPHGPICSLGAHHVGSAAELGALLAPIRKAVAPVNDSKVSMTAYREYQTQFDGIAARQVHGYLKSGFADRLSDGLIDALLGSISDATMPPGHAIILSQVGGAIARVAGDATAFPHRQAAYAVLFDLRWTEASQGDAIIAWARAAWQRLEPSLGGVYVNFTADDGQARVREAYGANYPRLAAIKRRYDPTNLFRLNVNVEPA